MPAAARVGHEHDGTNKMPRSKAEEGSKSVSIGGAPVLRVGDRFEDGTKVESGSLHVRINGKAAARMGDKVTGGGKIAEGCPKVRIGDGGGGEYAFQDLREKLEPNATEKEKLLLCLPDIAREEARREGNADDKKGWNYLRSMFYRWFNGNAEAAKPREKNPNAAPLFIDWDWVMRFWRARNAYTLFTSPDLASEPANIYNYAAQRSLGRILCREGYMHGKKHMDFDLTTLEWPDWEAAYHTLHAVPRGIRADGLQAA
ncbi:MAG: hypothetical protein LBC79_07415, partial [Deltaproteobacteria bacterium]|nr:hypothetical protein [Deltaproteobacteria bacterium]